MDFENLKNMLEKVNSISEENDNLDIMLEPKRILKKRMGLLDDIERIKPKITKFCELLALLPNNYHHIFIKNGSYIEASVLFVYDKDNNGIIAYPHYPASFNTKWEVLFTADRGLAKILVKPHVSDATEATQIRIENYMIEVIVKGFKLLECDLYNTIQERLSKLTNKNECLKKELKTYE